MYQAHPTIVPTMELIRKEDPGGSPDGWLVVLKDVSEVSGKLDDNESVSVVRNSVHQSRHRRHFIVMSHNYATNIR